MPPPRPAPSYPLGRMLGLPLRLSSPPPHRRAPLPRAGMKGSDGAPTGPEVAASAPPRPPPLLTSLITASTVAATALASALASSTAAFAKSSARSVDSVSSRLELPTGRLHRAVLQQHVCVSQGAARALAAQVETAAAPPAEIWAGRRADTHLPFILLSLLPSRAGVGAQSAHVTQRLRELAGGSQKGLLLCIMRHATGTGGRRFSRRRLKWRLRPPCQRAQTCLSRVSRLNSH